MPAHSCVLTSCWLLSDCSEDASLRSEGFWEELRDGTWETSKREKLGGNAADAGCLPKVISPARNGVCIWWLSSVTTPSPSLPTLSWCRTQMTRWRGWQPETLEKNMHFPLGHACIWILTPLLTTWDCWVNYITSPPLKFWFVIQRLAPAHRAVGRAKWCAWGKIADT